MARTDYGAILSTVIKDTSDAVREVNGTSSLIAPNQWGTVIRTMHSDSDYQNALEQMIEETATGDIASFSDGANDIPLKNLTCTINPVQDLHGQDYPYPAGGGKNLVPLTLTNLKSENATGTWNDNVYTVNQVAFTVNLDSAGNVTGIKANGTATGGSAIFRLGTFGLASGTNYAVNGLTHTGSQSTFRIILTNDNYTTAYLTVTDTSGGTRTGDGRTYGLQIVISNGTQMSNEMFYPMVRISAASDTYAPYSNICPITGHDTAVITRTGANLWGGDKIYESLVATGSMRAYGEDERGKYVEWSSTSVWKVPFPFVAKENAQYSIILNGWRNTATNVGTTYGFNCRLNYTDGTFSNISVVSGGSEVAVDIRVLSNESKTIESLEVVNHGGYTRLYTDYCGVFDGTITATDYKSYTAETRTAEFGQTIYGATINPLTGEGIIEYEKYKLPSTGWVASSGCYQHRFDGIMKPGSYYSDPQALCDLYPKIPTLGEATGVVFGYNSDYLYFYVSSDFETLSDWTTYLENNDVYVTMPLATPVPITFTPIENIKTLLGANNIFADTGDVEVTYRANGQLYVAQHT